jgi:hypothetical protein
MAQLTKRHRTVIERRLERIKQGRERKIMTRQRINTGVTKKEFHHILDKASQPISCETESGLEQP